MVVIGVGNEFRKDDGVGVRAVVQLKSLLPSDVLVFTLSGEGTELMQAWAHEHNIWLIDAVSSGAPCGTIYEIDAAADTVPAHFFHYSSHAFSVAEAIELSKAMDLLPPSVKLYGIEGKDFSSGIGLSPEVEASLSEVVRRVQRDIEESLASVPQLIGDTIAS